MKSVAVVTATTGRATLQQAIDSVAIQTWPCQHYVIVDGNDDVILPYDYPGEVIYLPKPTGGNGIMNGAILAAAAFLTTEDYICFLDDDNWFDETHVESLMNVIGDNAYAYSLRRLMEPDGSFWANDDGESLGHFGDMVDVNCYLMRRDVCAGIAPLWYRTDGTTMVGDRHVWAAFQQHNTPYAATGHYSVNYRMNARHQTKPFFFMRNIQSRARYPDGFPWAAR